MGDGRRSTVKNVGSAADVEGMSSAGRVFVVGLAGRSGSGKSNIARHIVSRLNGNVLSMETYAVSVNHLKFDERAKTDYDSPAATDIALLESHLRRLVAGLEIEAPIYDFAQHLRVAGRTQQVAARPLVIVEGILALHYAELRPHFDLSIYLDAPDEVCFHRRRVRDIVERQRDSAFVSWQWENMVQPAAKKYLLPSKRYADVVIDASREAAAVESAVEEAISAKRAKGAGF
jgi:uridine kinase